VSEPVERVERHVQRRDERRAAKSQKTERKGVNRVVDTKRLNGVEKFYQDTMSEIRKVQWPDREQTLNLTLLVIALSIVLGALLGGIDFVLLQLFETVG
jgi:preprotein translocase subunit SecE